jgi:hypothetical protein
VLVSSTTPLVVATTSSPQSAKMSVAGYFAWVGWKATLDARTGKTYVTWVFGAGLSGALLVDADGDGLAELDDCVGTADSAVGDGVKNCGVATFVGLSPGAPQPARQSAATVNAQTVRTTSTAPSWQKLLNVADPPAPDRLEAVSEGSRHGRAAGPLACG